VNSLTSILLNINKTIEKKKFKIFSNKFGIFIMLLYLCGTFKNTTMLKKAKKENLLKNSKGQYRYLFNWVGGGFNDIWAKNLTEFRTELKRQFGTSGLKVNYDTLHKCTQTQSKEWDRMGNMMCN